MADIPAKITNGARAQVMVGSKIIGTISNITWGVAYDTQDAYVLGKTACAEIGYTAQEPVSGQIQGWRVLDHGAYADLGLPTLQQLLVIPYTQLALFDRVTNRRVGMITDVRLLGQNGGFAIRQLSEYGVPYKGIMFSDETQTSAEAPGATSFPV